MSCGYSFNIIITARIPVQRPTFVQKQRPVGCRIFILCIHRGCDVKQFDTGYNCINAHFVCVFCVCVCVFFCLFVCLFVCLFFCFFFLHFGLLVVLHVCILVSENSVFVYV